LTKVKAGGVRKDKSSTPLETRNTPPFFPVFVLVLALTIPLRKLNIMKSPYKALLALLIATIALLATGCTNKTANDSSMPWGRPANWEGEVPGMGDMGNTSGTR